MKYISIIFFIIFSCSVYGQNIIATTENGDTVILKPNKTWDFAVKNEPVSNDLTKDWDLLTGSDDPIYGVIFYYQSNKIKTGILGGKETWIRIFPKSPTKYNKKNKIPLTTAYIQQFLTIECQSERYSLESAVFYDAKGKMLGSDKYWGFVAFDKILPGSVGEAMKETLCN